MRWDLICVFAGILFFASGQYLIGGCLVGASFILAIRSKK